MRMVMECGPCDGSLPYALTAIDTIARYPGVEMKVQWYTADGLTTRDAARYARTPSPNKTQYEDFQAQLTYDEWGEVYEHAKRKGVPFFPTVFEPMAVDAAVQMGIRTLKIASGDITYKQLIEYAARRSEELIISTGAANAGEVLDAERWSRGPERTFLACHLEYPTFTPNANLARVYALRKLLASQAPDWPGIGYSDHTSGIETIPYLTSMDLDVWEKHFTLGRQANGDHSFGLTPEELSSAIMAYQKALVIMGDESLTPSFSEASAREGARRSAVAARDIKSGEVVGMDDVFFLRPGTGISPAEFEEMVAPKGAGAMSASRRIRAFVDIPAGTVIDRKWVGLTGATLTVE